MPQTMLILRQATEKDSETILNIQKELDLYYPGRPRHSFFVAEEGKEIVGIVQLEEFDDSIFLSSFGVVQKRQHQGITKSMFNEIFKKFKKDIYLYTIIPDFFKKFGFKVISAPKKIPSRDTFDCAECYSEKCVCMVRKNDT